MENKITYQYHDNVLQINFIGELDGLVTPKYRCIIDELLEVKKTDIVFDFKQTTFIDSAGIGLLLGRYKQVNRNGNKTSIQNTNPITYKLLELSGLFEIMSYREETRC